MADEPKDLAPDPATLPGGANFDVESASDADYKEHKKILTRRKEMADLAPATPLTATIEGVVPAPVARPAKPVDEISAVHSVTGQPRNFSAVSWDLMGDDKSGYVEAVAKPADLE